MKCHKYPRREKVVAIMLNDKRLRMNVCEVPLCFGLHRLSSVWGNCNGSGA